MEYETCHTVLVQSFFLRGIQLKIPLELRHTVLEYAYINIRGGGITQNIPLRFCKKNGGGDSSFIHQKCTILVVFKHI